MLTAICVWSAVTAFAASYNATTAEQAKWARALDFAIAVWSAVIAWYIFERFL